MQIRSTKVFYFEKYFENTILFCIFKILFRSRPILHITEYASVRDVLILFFASHVHMTMMAFIHAVKIN